LTEPFRVLVADPPWRFGDRLPGPKRGAAKHYACMTVAEICAFPIPVMADDSLLLLWRVSSMVEEAYQVVRAWGFTPKTEIIWRKLTRTGKPHFGMGRTVRAAHETAIVAHRGRPPIKSRSIRSVFAAEVGEHSAKPELFFGLVEALSDGPYVELFARRPRPGWTCLGNEVSHDKEEPMTSRELRNELMYREWRNANEAADVVEKIVESCADQVMENDDDDRALMGLATLRDQLTRLAEDCDRRITVNFRRTASGAVLRGMTRTP
jgi:N6-adenosine-specific RNA methylase IME4